MKKFVCPHCKNATISLWQKVRISPLSDIRCEACGSQLTIRYVAGVFAASPLFVGYPLLSILKVVTTEREQWLLLVVTFVISLFLVTFAVPIIASKRARVERQT